MYSSFSEISDFDRGCSQAPEGEQPFIFSLKPRA
jgi:hypothetical protein